MPDTSPAAVPPTPRYVATHRDQAPSYWQPQPANGYSSVMLDAAQTVSGAVSMGTQTIAPGCFVREHAHPAQEELIFVLEGNGVARIEGVDHAMVSGALFYLGPTTRHTFLNTGDSPLTFTWTMLPAGLEKFFAAIGKPRQPGEPAPVPFARPADIKSIELGTVFVDLAKLDAERRGEPR
jgi:quercetin dioxygenase-like cupin family protein